MTTIGGSDTRPEEVQRREAEAVQERWRTACQPKHGTAEEEWKPHAQAYYDGPGDITSDNEHALAEHRLALANAHEVGRIARVLSHDCESNDYAAKPRQT